MVEKGAMLLPLLLLVILWLSPPCSATTSLTPATLGEDGATLGADGPRPPSCLDFNISYPFGFSDHSSGYREGFHLVCHDGGRVYLRLGSKNVRLLGFSLQEGQVTVQLSAFAWRCGARGFGQRSMIDLEGTPYVFSHVHNKLTVVGCDALALVEVSGPLKRIGCASFCVSEDNVIGGACSGLKRLDVELSSIWNLTGSRFSREWNSTGYFKNLTAGRGYALCSYAFLADQFEFHSSELSMTYNDKGWPAVLDWWIGNETCMEAMKKTTPPYGYACLSNNSICYDSPSGGGYRCNCTDGYRGNPYVPDVPDGCQDIDECSERDPCVHKCINKPGGYNCSCRLGMTGDGRKEGTGCRRVAPLEIGLGLGLLSLILMVTGGRWSYWGWQKRKLNNLKQHFFMRNGGALLQQHISSREAIARIFTSEELEKATDGFDDSRVVGHGGYGTVFKGILADQRVVAIKKSKLVDETQMEQFINEVVILSQINHRNVVKLLGCCLETEVPLLVYEFISNGTLFHHVHERDHSSPPMSWEDRLRIATETAAALAHLHSAAALPVIHRDVKSANILLDENFNAKVSDFGASRLLPYKRTHVTTIVQGTLGYLDPEYFHTSQLTDKSDVYSFGVVLVELLTREKPVSFFRSDEERNLASYFVLLDRERRLLDVVDQQTFAEAGIRHLSAVAQLAIRCLSVKGEERPMMREVAVELDALRRLLKQSLVQEGREEGVILQVAAEQEEPTGSTMLVEDSIEMSLLVGSGSHSY